MVSDDAKRELIFNFWTERCNAKGVTGDMLNPYADDVLAKMTHSLVRSIASFKERRGVGFWYCVSQEDIKPMLQQCPTETLDWFIAKYGLAE